MTLNTDLQSQFNAARLVSTPLMAFWTADPAALVDSLLAQVGKDDNGKAYPALQWDLVRGINAVNEAAKPVVKKMHGDGEAAMLSAVPTDALRLLEAKTPIGTVCFFLNGPRYWDAPDVAQAIWNLRDTFKASNRALVIIGPSGKLPAELEHDVVVFEDALPNRDELSGIIDTLHTAAGVKTTDTKTKDRAIDAMAGLSAFSAEQVAAMSLRKDGIDLSALRARRRLAIENTPGLSVYRGADRFEDIGGHAQIKSFFGRVRDKAKEPIKAIAFIDELDKAMGGAGVANSGDNTGISQDQLKVLLTNIQDTGGKGSIAYGVPGTGKTFFARALANELGCELVTWDMGAMITSAAGGSQERIRAACKVTNAVGQGQTLWLATCNSTATIPTELRRRFSSFGEWFFDLPQADETPGIVKIYLERYGLKVSAKNPLPDLAEWTGAEVQRLMYLAYNLDLTFLQAAAFVVPMKTSAADVVERLRKQAAGRFLSTFEAGFYRTPQEQQAERDSMPTRSRTRSITLDPLTAAALGPTRES